MIEKTITTTSELVQDNPDVTPETTQTNTIQNSDLIFGQKHKDIDCALCPTAKRACDRAWVTAKQIENWSGMSTKTLWRRLNELEECERISRLQDFANVNIPTETGNENPLLQHTKARGFFCRRQVDTGLCRFLRRQIL